MQLEAIGSVSVSNLSLEAFGQVDDLNSLERTSLDTHAAANAHDFRYKADFAGLSDLNAEFVGLVDWAGLLALLRALFGLAFVGIDYCNSQFLGVHAAKVKISQRKIACLTYMMRRL